MSDLDSKNSSGSEMNSSVKAKDDSLDLMQQMIKEQQQHLVSDYQYQYDMNNISVEKEGKRPGDWNINKEMRIKSINQQHSIWNEIKKVSVKDNYSNASGIASQKTAASKEESPDLQQVSNSLHLALEMNLSSREIPKQNHLEQTSVRSEISYQAGVLSSQEQADDSDQSESRASAASSVREVPTPALIHSSPNDWRRLEQELTDFFSELEANDESISHDSTPATAELKSPPAPDILNGDSAADSPYHKLCRESYPCQVSLPLQSTSQVLPKRLDTQCDDEEDDNIDDRKPPANSSNNDDAEKRHT